MVELRYNSFFLFNFFFFLPQKKKNTTITYPNLIVGSLGVVRAYIALVTTVDERTKFVSLSGIVQFAGMYYIDITSF